MSREKTLGADRAKTLGVNRAKTLGVLGNGQLGRMFVQAAQSMGFRAVVFDPEAQKGDALSPAAQASDAFINANFSDTAALQSLADQCAAVTTEFENVSAEALAFLAKPSGAILVAPKADAVRIAQNRVLEKKHFEACGVPIAPYVVIDSQQQLECVAADFYPAILKTARMGYDGKGQVTVKNAVELRAAWEGLSQATCVLEQRVALASECSVLLARQVGVDPDSAGGARMIHWPVQRNVHVDGILATTEVSNSENPTQASQALLDAALTSAAQKIATDLDYVGVLCVEFFILADGSWVVNEIAPRPHNSGHVTMNGSSLSQFEAQVRVLARLPLVQPRQHSSCVMINLLGDVWQGGEPDWARVLALGNANVGVHLHLYGKAEARPGRKMGHINITAQTLDTAWQTARSIQQLLQ